MTYASRCVMLLTCAALSLAWPLAGRAQGGLNSDFDHFTTGFRLEGSHRTAACESCHVDGVFEGTPRDCASCHALAGRVRATAKPVAHVQSADFCEDCHRATAWFPLAEMNHDSVYGSCSTCHNNVQSVGKPPDHPAAQAECDVCHRATAWLPAGFDHSMVVPGTCSSCHNGVSATGKDVDHFTTQRECDHCHDSDFWEPLVFAHVSAAYPGDHRVGLVCADCHTTDAELVPWPFPAYAPDCAACHAGDFELDEHEGATVSELRDCAGTCHETTPEHSVTSREW